MMRKILFISRKAPYGNSLPREALDALLAASAYDQELSLLFMDDGVFQLMKNQHSISIRQKNMASSLQALELYEIENIYCLADSLIQRGLDKADLIFDKIKLIDNIAVHELMSQQDQLISF
jgi:tRNA 2-thiouridine synthesizing protein C